MKLWLSFGLCLAHRLGVGYHMNMVRLKRCNVAAVTKLIKHFVPEAGLESDAGAELSYVLPHERSSK